MGRAKITSAITWESAEISFGVLHLGDHNLNGGVRNFLGEENYEAMVRETIEAFEHGDLAERLRIVDKHFGSATYTLNLLFRDQQHHILRLILQSALAEAEAAYRRIYERGAPLMRFVASLGMPQPNRFQIAAEFTLNSELRRLLETEPLDVDQIRSVLEEMGRAGVVFDEATLEFALRRNLEEVATSFLDNPNDVERLQAFDSAANVATMLPFKVRLWQPQNVFYEILQRRYADFRDRAAQNDELAQAWVGLFLALGNKLSVYVS